MSLKFPTRADIPPHLQIEKISGRILIGGKILSQGFETKLVTSPCSLLGPSGELEYPELGTTPNVSEEIFAQAVDAATLAWNRGRGEWPSSRMEERINAMVQFRNELQPKRETIAKMLMWEIAKTWPDAQAEFDRTLQYIDDTIEAAKQLDRDSARIHFAGGLMAQIRRAPFGVTLALGPFNYPLNETFTTLIPALITGNTVVVKMPRFGQLFWDHMLEAFQKCFPSGVINIVNGLGRNIIGPSVKAGKIDALAFIGSSHVANQIKQGHPRASSFRAVLGLDAKNPGIVLPSADLDRAVAECVKGSLSFNGQRCTALKILLVHRSIAEDFTKKLTRKVDALGCGLPWETGVSITPLPDPRKPGELQLLIQDAVSAGARLCNPERGGKQAGTLMFPAVLDRVPLSSKLAHVEQFGPVVPIVEFDTDDELENYMLNSPYGMQASLFGEDPTHLGKLVDFLANQVCRINLNTQCQRGPDVFPFTGRKASAEGTLSVTDALRCFSIRSMVAAKQDADGKHVFKGLLEGDHSNFLTTNIVL